MNFFFGFVQKFRYFILFLFLEIISLVLVVNKNAYHNLVFNKQLLAFNGWYTCNISSVVDYFNLKQQNQDLQQENNRLKSLIYGTVKIDSLKIRQIQDSLYPNQVYEFISAKTSNQKTLFKDNYFLINRGKNEGIKEDMGVISPNGVVGQIVDVGSKYSKVMSVLNTKIRLNSRLKKSEYLGTTIWKAEDVRIMHLMEIPRYVDISIGDTVETSASRIFPEGLPIGRVAGFSIEPQTGSWDISVELFQEMGKLSSVNVVRKIINKPKIDTLNNVK